MAKKPTNSKSPSDQDEETLFNPIPGISDVALTQEDQVDIDQINEILKSQDASNGKIRLERKTPDDTTFQYLVSIPINQFDIEWVKRVHGGGDYRGKIFRSNGQMYKNIEFSIDYRVKGSKDSDSGPRTVAYQPDPMKQVKELADMVLKNQPKDTSSDLLREIMAQSRQDSQMMMTTLITTMTKSAETQTAMMTGMFSALAQQKPQPSQSSLEPVLPALLTALAPVLIKLIDRPASTPTTNLHESIELIKSIKETFAGEEKGEETVLGSFMKAVAPAFQAMTGMNGNGRQGGLPHPPRPLPPPADHGAVPPRPPVNQPDPQVQMINQYVGMLYNAAEMNADPAIYADMLFNHAPPEFLSRLVTTLKKDDWTTTLFNNDPKVINNLQWFEELRSVILETYEQSNSDPNTDPGELVKSGVSDDSLPHDGTGGGTHPGADQGDGGNNQPAA